MIGKIYGVTERLRSMLLMLLFTSLLAASGWLWHWDQVLYDLQLRALSGDPADDIVIVAVDEQSLQAQGRWPWSREVHARLVEQLTLAGARAIVLDFYLGKADGAEPAADSRLIQALAASDRVFLPVVLKRQQMGGIQVASMPLPELANVATGLGQVVLQPDADGIARGIYLYAGFGETPWPHLMLTLREWLQASQADESSLPLASQAVDAQQLNRYGYRLIPFGGPTGSYAHYAYSRVLDGDFEADLFRDRIVLVGVTAGGLDNAVATPISGREMAMPEVEILANILDSLRQESTIEPIGFSFHLVISGLLGALPILLFAYFPSRFAPLVVGGVLLSFMALDWLLLYGTQRWFPPSAALLGLLLSYPAWHWRRLDLAMRYFNRQLLGLQREQGVLDTTPSPSGLLSALDFLGHLMPLRGWVLYEGGRQLNAVGEALGEPLEFLANGVWRRSGAELWIRLPRAGKPWRLGLLWPRAQVPQGRALQVLEELAQQFNRTPESAVDSQLERVASRMQQLQESDARQHRMGRLMDDLLGQLDEGLLVIDCLGRVVLSNPRAARCLGTPLDEALQGKAIDALLQPLVIDEAGTWQERLRRVYLEGESMEFEARRDPDAELTVRLKPLDQSGMSGMLIILTRRINTPPLIVDRGE